jgi:PAS domain-containing protein
VSQASTTVGGGARATFARQTPINAGVTLCMSSLTAVLLWLHLPVALVAIWLLASWLAVGLPLLLWYRLQGQPKTRPISPRGRRRATLFALAAGSLWGVLALFVDRLPEEYEYVLLVVACGMVAGATATLSAVPSAARAYAATVLIPWIAHFATQPDLAHGLVALMVVVFGLAMHAAATAIHRGFQDYERAKEHSLAMERQLRERQTAWDLLSATTEAFALFDADDRLVLWNTRLLTVFDLSADAVRQGLPLPELLRLGARPSAAHGEVMPATAWCEQLRRLADPGEAGIVSQLSNRRWLHSSAKRTADGHLVFSHVDIT